MTIGFALSSALICASDQMSSGGSSSPRRRQALMSYARQTPWDGRSKACSRRRRRIAFPFLPSSQGKRGRPPWRHCG